MKTAVYYFSFALVRMHLFYSQVVAIVLIVMNVVGAVSKVLIFHLPIESKLGSGNNLLYASKVTL